MTQLLARIGDATLWRHFYLQSLPPEFRGRNLAGIGDAMTLITPFFQQPDHERLCTILLNRWNVVLGVLVAEGQRDWVAVCPRMLVGTALQLEAASVILTHNHPSGDPRPSKADISVTRHLVNVLRALNIALVDHLTLARNTFTSFRQEGIL